MNLMIFINEHYYSLKFLIDYQIILQQISVVSLQFLNYLVDQIILFQVNYFINMSFIIDFQVTFYEGISRLLSSTQQKHFQGKNIQQCPESSMEINMKLQLHPTSQNLSNLLHLIVKIFVHLKLSSEKSTLPRLNNFCLAPIQYKLMLY